MPTPNSTRTARRLHGVPGVEGPCVPEQSPGFTRPDPPFGALPAYQDGDCTHPQQRSLSE